MGWKSPPHYLVDEEQGLFWDNIIPFWFNVDNVDKIPQSSSEDNLIDISDLLKFPIPSYKSWMKYFENKAILDPQIIMICGNLYETETIRESYKTLTFNTNTQTSEIKLQNSSKKIVWTDKVIHFVFQISEKSYEFVISQDGKIGLMQPFS